MDENRGNCPLSARLLELLRVCVAHNTTGTKELAKITGSSRHTIDDKFKKINRKLGTQKRDAALRLAETNGWLAIEDYRGILGIRKPLLKNVLLKGDSRRNQQPFANTRNFSARGR